MQRPHNKWWRWPLLFAPTVTAVILMILASQPAKSNQPTHPVPTPPVQSLSDIQLSPVSTTSVVPQPTGYIRPPSVDLSADVSERLSTFRQWALETSAAHPGDLVLQGRGLRVALTFDDGPNAATSEILEALGNTHCTFFLVGTGGSQWETRVAQIEAAGHELAMHSDSHPRLAELEPAAIESEITHNRDAIAAITGSPPILFRPPYGHIPEDMLSWCAQQGLTVVDWSIDSLDWHLQDEETIRKNVLDSLHPGAIVLLHSQPQTAKLLPELMSRIREAGYELVTVSEMMR